LLIDQGQLRVIRKRQQLAELYAAEIDALEPVALR